jgi:shikimate kinase
MGGRTVSLVGFMGSGKSTVGRVLAARLRWPFKDTDALIEAREGQPAESVRKVRGLDYFRDLERRVVLSTPEEGTRVMAVGFGGYTEETIPFLDRLGPTIHLDLTFEEVKRRVGENPARPLARDPKLFGVFIKEKRFYARARHRIWTEGLTVDEVVDAALRLI